MMNDEYLLFSAQCFSLRLYSIHDENCHNFQNIKRLITFTLYQEVTGNSVTVWGGGRWSVRRLVQDNTTLVWADTLAMDESGLLWATTRGWPLDSRPRIVNIYTGDNKPFDYC